MFLLNCRWDAGEMMSLCSPGEQWWSWYIVSVVSPAGGDWLVGSPAWPRCVSLWADTRTISPTTITAATHSFSLNTSQDTQFSLKIQQGKFKWGSRRQPGSQQEWRNFMVVIRNYSQSPPNTRCRLYSSSVSQMLDVTRWSHICQSRIINVTELLTTIILITQNLAGMSVGLFLALSLWNISAGKFRVIETSAGYRLL